MAEHIPGPWRIGSLASYDAYTGKPFCNVWAGDPDVDAVVVARCVDNGTCDEDARLIAAAPELLDAARAVLARLDYLRSLWGDEGVTRRLADQLRDAIRKATGE